MDKNRYQEPDISVILLEQEEVIRTSGPDTDTPFGDGGMDGPGWMN